MKTKITMIILAVMLIALSNVSAYQRLCLTDGDSVPSKQNARYTCEHDSCQVCVTDNYYPTSPDYCDDLTGCNQFSGENGDLDSTPPVITVSSPVNNEVYSSRSVLFNIKTDEESTIYYIDNINGRGRWSRLIVLSTSYNKKISFKDGLNDISIKAVDENGNSAETELIFYVDSQKPKITKTEPKKGFAIGTFTVYFTEQNPSSLTLIYGNQLKGRTTVNVPLSGCSNNGAKYTCSIIADLSSYNENTIDYKFKLTDIAGSYVESKYAYLDVDTTSPMINNPDSMVTVSGKYAYFKINIAESNLDEVSYYNNMDSKPAWKKLCTKLKNGICEKKITLKSGENVLDIKVTDEAGNSITKRITLDRE